MAPSKDPTDVLVTSLAIVFGDKEICFGKHSALGDRVRTADRTSLKDVASKLNGRHLLGDGRPFVVTADYMTPDRMNPGMLIGIITPGAAEAMECTSVCSHSRSATITVIHKLLLRDPRQSTPY